MCRYFYSVVVKSTNLYLKKIIYINSVTRFLSRAFIHQIQFFVEENFLKQNYYILSRTKICQVNEKPEAFMNQITF